MLLSDLMHRQRVKLSKKDVRHEVAVVDEDDPAAEDVLVSWVDFLAALTTP